MSAVSPSGVAEPARRFLGWRIAGLATITGATTGPGQTIGVSVSIDPLIAELGLSRPQVSAAYLIGTLAGAAVWLVVVPIGHFGIVDRPTDVDQRPDGDGRVASVTFAGPSPAGPVTLALLAETGGGCAAAAWWLTSIPLATGLGALWITDPDCKPHSCVAPPGTH